MDEDSKSDVSEIQSQRTGSVLSGRDGSDTGGLDAADSQPGTYYNSQSHAQNANSPYWLSYISFNISSENLEAYQGQLS